MREGHAMPSTGANSPVSENREPTVYCGLSHSRNQPDRILQPFIPGNSAVVELAAAVTGVYCC
jgi:hypothetical protein